ncbi:MAG: GtrA family protein [Proteobacteria bacterium]|nr:GtrA family protein [Pseudomonadota bacterium]NBX86528.1 GtrA family protein [Pseudomonadota bacterium]
MLKISQFLHNTVHWLIAPLYHRLPKKFQHLMLFVISGGMGFTTDGTILLTLEYVFNLSPFIARIFSIIAAVCVSWLAHRTLTFAVQKAPTWAEFTSFVALAASGAILNYLVFSATLWLNLSSHSLPAMIFSSLTAMFYSYLGMRFGVFRKIHTLKHK